MALPVVGGSDGAFGTVLNNFLGGAAADGTPTIPNNRIPYLSGGNHTSSANLTFDGTTLTVGTLALGSNTHTLAGTLGGTYTIGGTPTLGANLTVSPTGTWIGLGSAAGRVVFDNETVDAVTVSTGSLRIDTGVAIPEAGTLLIPKAGLIRSVNNAGNATIALISHDGTAQNAVLIGNASQFVIGGYIAAASLPAAAAGMNGGIAVDSTNNRFVFYSGGARYYITGTSF